jgi:hypothetical protein
VRQALCAPRFQLPEVTLAEIASEGAEAVAILVRTMKRIWSSALIEDYVRAN